MKNFKHLFLLLTAAVLLHSCADMNAKEIGRVQASRFSDLVPKSKYINLKKGDKIAIWSDMDFEYNGSIDLLFKVEMYLGEELKESLEFDPLQRDLTMNEVKSTVNSKTSWSFSGKNKEIVIKQGGNYKCVAYLKASNTSFRVNKADIVFKRKK